MNSDSITKIDKQIENLINDKTQYNFVELKDKVEEILKSEDVFINDNKLETKAFDLYFNMVITRRNNLKKKTEETNTKADTKIVKYNLIESICKKLEFNSNEDVIKKVEELENKSLTELNNINQELNNSLKQ